MLALSRSFLVVPILAACAIADSHPAGSHWSRDTPSTLTASGLPGGWKLGAACVSDVAAPNRLLSWNDNPANMTISSCLDECAFHGFVYAGVQFGQECWCGNSLNTAGGAGVTLSASCNAPCLGDKTSLCGGTFALSLYNRTLESPYTKSTIHKGTSFFDGWSFFSSPDPTGGSVAFQPKSAAMSKKLAYVRSDGVAVLKVDNTTTLQPGQNRSSVRISTTATYTTALMIFDILAMPWGCSIWPALWTVGPNWPNGGEIDVIEGVNNMTNNQLTFHTGPTTSCNISNVPQSWVTAAGVGSQICASSQESDAGCGYFESSDPAAATYGQSFNAAGGAIYALLLDDNGGKIWRWKHSEVPNDLDAGQAPTPDGWGPPTALLLSDSSCPTQSLIKQQSIVIDTTLCGGWCRDTYIHMGCGATCTERIPDPRNYDNAYWLIKSVTIWE